MDKDLRILWEKKQKKHSLLIKVYNSIPFLNRLHPWMNNVLNSISLALTKKRWSKTIKMKRSGITIHIKDDILSVAAGWLKLEITQDEIWDYIDKLTFKPGDVILDFGANLGLVSIYMAKKHPYIKIYAYEPVPKTFAYLQENIKLNQCSNITAFNLAITADGRDVQMAQADVNSISSTVIDLKTDQPRRNIRSVGGGRIIDSIKSITPSKIFSENNIDHVTLLKCDVEGAEQEFIPSMLHLLNKVDHIAMEVHGSEEGCKNLMNTIKQNMRPDADQCFDYLVLQEEKVTI